MNCTGFSLLLTAFSPDEQFTLSISTLITGLVVVFSVLVLLVIVIKIFGSIIYGANNRKKKRAKKKSKREAPPEPATAILAAAATAVPPAAATPHPSHAGIPEEVVAVIAAAVSVMTGGTVLSIRKSKRQRAGRPVWSRAGLLENTRPF